MSTAVPKSPDFAPQSSQNQRLSVPTDTRWQRTKEWLSRQAKNSPARLAVLVFAGIIAIITLFLSLPIASTGHHTPAFIDVLFTAVSAVCVTGLTTLDTATQWTPFGQAVIAAGMMIGGLGVMTLASILGFVVSRHLGLTQRMLAAAETKQNDMSQLSSLLSAVLITSLTVEGILTLVFFPRFLAMEGMTVGAAAWQALFMAISVFNNAGFTIIDGGLQPFTSDWWMLFPIIVGTFVGAIGFPVIRDLYLRWRTPRKWMLHTKLTLSVYLILAFVGAILIALTEWSNPQTLGSLSTTSKTLNLLLAAVNTRSSGLSAIDVSAMHTQTHFIQDILMMIGGGSGSTAGGIKVTTFAILVLAVVAEARGDHDIETFGRRIPNTLVRLAISVTLMGTALVGTAVILLLSITDYALDDILFESVSAFATVGLSTGITPELPDAGKAVLALLMFAGRVGTMTMAAALAIRERSRLIRQPEERIIVG